MSPAYEIDITLSPQTLTELKDGGFALYGFKAVNSPVIGAAPLVWLADLNFLNATRVQWTDQYQAYVSKDEIIPDGRIDADAAIDVNLGQTAQVGADGNLTSADDGAASAISILNQAGAPWTAGISQMVDGSVNPVCAMPLHGDRMDVVTPIEKVLLMFASNTINTGTVVYRAYASSLLVDMTGSNTRAVSFDIDRGWSWDGGVWGTPITPNANLVPLLIENS